MLNRLGVDHRIDRWMDEQTERQTKAIAYSADKPILIKLRA